MSLDQNWDRWIFASVSKKFDAAKQGIPLFVEGQHRDETDKEADLFELRIDGPYYTEVSKDCWDVFTEINVLVQSAMDNKDFHQMRRLTGIASAMFTNTLEIFKFGDGVSDDDSLLDCMSLVQDKRGRERIQTSDFGQIETSVTVPQDTVEGHNRMLENTYGGRRDEGARLT